MGVQKGRTGLCVLGIVLLLTGCGGNAASGGSEADSLSSAASAESLSGSSADIEKSDESAAGSAEKEKVTPAPTQKTENQTEKKPSAVSAPGPEKTPEPTKTPRPTDTPAPTKTPAPTETPEPTEPTVTEPRRVRITYPTGTIMIGDAGPLEATLYPSEVTDTIINWTSSDPNVISLYDDGTMAAVGPGTATLTAETDNGLTDSAVVTVDASWRQMNADVAWERDDENDIGDQWAYTFLINGAPVTGPYTVSAGDTISVYAQITENDDSPDIGEASYDYVVTEDDLISGFWIELEMYVTEDTGENAGESAHYKVRYTFSV